MTDDFTNKWRGEDAGAHFTDPARLEGKASLFERRVTRRNRIEYAAGVLVIGMFGAGAIGAADAGKWDFAAMLTLTVIGTLVLMWNLHRRGSNLDRRLERDSMSHIRAQYSRQIAALRSVPAWYIGPLVPGVVGIYGLTAFHAAKVTGWGAAIEKLGPLLGGTLAFFAFVIWINLKAAQKLEREMKTFAAV